MSSSRDPRTRTGRRQTHHVIKGALLRYEVCPLGCLVGHGPEAKRHETPRSGLRNLLFYISSNLQPRHLYFEWELEVPHNSIMVRSASLHFQQSTEAPAFAEKGLSFGSKNRGLHAKASVDWVAFVLAFHGDPLPGEELLCSRISPACQRPHNLGHLCQQGGTTNQDMNPPRCPPTPSGSPVEGNGLEHWGNRQHSGWRAA